MINLWQTLRSLRAANDHERRSTRRGRVLLSGKMVYGTGFTADCCIRDLTPRGAKVKLPPHHASPGEFYLIVVRDGVAHRSRTQWAQDGEVGVTFEDSHHFGDATPAHMQPMRDIWAELAPRPYPSAAA